MVKESVQNVGNRVSIPGSGRSPRERNGNPLQYSCLENSMDRWAIVHGVTKSRKGLSDWTELNWVPVGKSQAFWLGKLENWNNHGLLPARLPCPWNSPGKVTGVGCHSFLWGIFLTQTLNPALLNCRQILYWLSNQEACLKVALVKSKRCDLKQKLLVNKQFTAQVQ